MNVKLRSSPISYFKLLKVVLSRWYWLLFSLMVGLTTCFVCLIFTPQQYRSSATMKFDDKKSEITELLNVRNLYDRTNKVESEKNIILSRTVLSAAIHAIDYRIAYFRSINLQLTDVYPNKLLDITFYLAKPGKIKKHLFEYLAINNKHFQLCVRSKDQNYCGIYSYNKPFYIFGLKLLIKNSILQAKDGKVFFQIVNIDRLISSIRKAIKVDDTQNTNILNIKYEGPNAQFCTDIVDAIISEYLHFDVKQKELALVKTSQFLNLLLNEISLKAKNSALALQSYKEVNNVANIDAFFTAQEQTLESINLERHALEMSSKSLQFAYRQVIDVSRIDSSTYNLQGIDDPHLSSLVEKYGLMVSERREKLNTFTISSPPIQFLDQGIASTRKSIINGLSERLALNVQLSKKLKKFTDSLNSILGTSPEIEKNTLALTSKFELELKIQTFLAQKKLETQIVNAAITPGASIIDGASPPDDAITPNPTVCYLTTSIFSLIAGTFAILIIHLYNPFLYTKEQIEELTTIPIVGVVRRSPSYNGLSNNEIIIQNYPRSSFAESIRFVRGNLSFIAPEASKVICITSETSGEGKSFLAMNLAYALTLTQNKVVLIAGDLRQSTSHITFKVNNANGLSKYLSGQTELEAICSETWVKNLDFISAGPTPPNPSELLQSPSMTTLLTRLKEKYDVIIIDSAPIGLVSDIKPVMRLSDINLFILRSGVSKHQYAQTPERLKLELKLSNVAIILNDFKADNFHNHYYKDNG